MTRRIIDSHTHIFPAKIEEKAVASVGAFYDISMFHRGTEEELVLRGSKAGISKYLVCSTATKPEQVVSINDFIIGACSRHEEFIGFGTIHPYMENMEAELERIISHGLKGVKLHPDFLGIYLDEPASIKAFRLCAKHKLPLLFHTGDDRYDYSSPERLANAMSQVEDMVAIAAHFGGYRCWDEVLKYLKADNGRVFFDTSSSLFVLDKQKARDMIFELGTHRFFFGSDFPMWDPQKELDRFLALELPEDVNSAILYDNFSGLLGL